MAQRKYQKLNPRIGIHEIARRAGLSPSHTSKIFSGDRIPSLVVAATIADVMGVSLDALYEKLRKARNAAIAEHERQEKESAKA